MERIKKILKLTFALGFLCLVSVLYSTDLEGQASVYDSSSVFSFSSSNETLNEGDILYSFDALFFLCEDDQNEDDEDIFIDVAQLIDSCSANFLRCCKAKFNLYYCLFNYLFSSDTSPPVV